MLMMSPSVTDTGNVQHGVQHWGRAGKTLQARCAMADVAALCAIPVLGMPKPAVCILHGRRDACDTARKSFKFVPFSMLERHFDDHAQSALEGIFSGVFGFF